MLIDSRAINTENQFGSFFLIYSVSIWFYRVILEISNIMFLKIALQGGLVLL
jgi:hypothetical protein